jgi:uncharacterized protein
MKTGIKIGILILSVSLLAAACNRTITGSYIDGTAQLAGKILDIELADTPDKQSQGLSGRESIGEGQGMLFVFNQPAKHSFWMKDMRFPIDIIWIKDGKIIDISSEVQIEPDAQTTGSLRTYSPVSEVDKVLEVKSGWALRHNLKVGDNVELKLK